MSKQATVEKGYKKGKVKLSLSTPPVAYRGAMGGSNPPPAKFRPFDKSEPNSQYRGKYIRNNLIRIRVSLIYKLSGTAD
jgi:hypothetical protein